MKGKIVQGFYSCKELPRRIAALSTTGDVEAQDIVCLESLEARSRMPFSKSSTNTLEYPRMAIFSQYIQPVQLRCLGPTVVLSCPLREHQELYIFESCSLTERTRYLRKINGNYLHIGVEVPTVLVNPKFR